MLPGSLHTRGLQTQTVPYSWSQAADLSIWEGGIKKVKRKQVGMNKKVQTRKQGRNSHCNSKIRLMTTWTSDENEIRWRRITGRARKNWKHYSWILLASYLYSARSFCRVLQIFCLDVYSIFLIDLLGNRGSYFVSDLCFCWIPILFRIYVCFVLFLISIGSFSFFGRATSSPFWSGLDGDEDNQAQGAYSQ